MTPSKSIQRAKQKLLLKAGCYTKEPVDNDRENEEGVYGSMDNYYKIVYEEVTDEELEELLKYSQHFDNSTEEKSDGICTALYIFGTIIIFTAFILGITQGFVEVDYYSSTRTTFSFAITVIYWASGLFAGLFLIGIGRIIKVLNKIAG